MEARASLPLLENLHKAETVDETVQLLLAAGIATKASPKDFESELRKYVTKNEKLKSALQTAIPHLNNPKFSCYLIKIKD
jgi:hypothetical protein